MSNLFYDENWKLTLSNVNYNFSNDYGAFTGNGKLGCYNSLLYPGLQKTLLSGNIEFDQIGKYKNNTIECFNSHNIKVISNTSSNINYTLIHQSLDMQNGSVESYFNVKDENNSNYISISNKITPLRQYPYCILQTIKLKPFSNINTLDVFHEIESPVSLSEQEYNNNVIYNESISSEEGLYILNGVGTIRSLNTQVSTASCYLFESSNVKKLGFNVFNDKSKCYQKHRFLNVGSNEVSFHILSSQMSSYDFKSPLEEVKRILMNITFKDTTSTSNLISSIQTDNLTSWNNIWNSDIDLIPKNTITINEENEVYSVKKYIRYSLFQIYSCLRESVNTQINPLNLSYVDTNGSIYFDGDLWLIPVLNFIKPNISKTLLEFKYRNLEQALQLSASFGYKGSKYPYKNDIIGYNSIYWDVVSPLHIFNNSMIAINVWNYYRVSLDKEWLLNKGYNILKNIAEFLISYIQYTGGQYIMKNTLGLGKIISDHQAFTSYTTLLALRGCIEASYVLGYIPPQSWLDIFAGMNYPVITTGPLTDIIKYDNNYDGTTDIDILDNLLILHPYLNNIYFSSYTNRNNEAILKNLDYYFTRVQNEYENNPLNNIIRASLFAVVSQTDNLELTEFEFYLNKIFNENFRGYWGYLNINNDPSIGNDVSLNASFILLMLTCIGGLSIRGSTAPSNLITEAFRIQDTLSAFMPKTWFSLNLSGIGRDELFVNVSNQSIYP